MRPPPRLLFLTSEPPHTGAAGAIVLQRLFTGYPADRLLVVTNNPPPPGAGRLDCRHVRLPLLADRLNRTRFWPWRAALRALGGTSLLDLGRIDAVLEGFQPDAVATLMQDCWYYDYAARYARRHGLPLVLFVHDLADGFEPVPPWLKRRQQRSDARVYGQAKHRFCVSEPMRRHFLQEFGLDGEVLLPPRSDTSVRQEPEACSSLKHPGRLTLGYAGGLHYGYGEQLLRMMPVLRETGTVIELFGPKPTGVVAALNDATDVCRFNGYISPPEAAWRSLLARCDAVLQPYLNPPGPHARQYRTHFPSKLGDCLSLGLPLLVTGPVDASGVSWCREHGDCALPVPTPDPAALLTALRRLRDEPQLRIDLARRGQAAAGEYEGATLRATLRQRLQDLSSP